MKQRTKLDLIREMVDHESSPEEILSLGRMTRLELEAELVRRTRAYAAACRREAKRWCPKCHRRGCRNLMHLIMPISPWKAPCFSALPKTKSPMVYHQWLIDELKET